MNIKSLFALILTLLLLAFLIAACAESKGGLSVSVTPEGTYSVDPVFRKYYDDLGGVQVLGFAISPMFQEGARKFQYVQAGCLVFNPSLIDRDQLAPLGLDMQIEEPPVPEPAETTGFYVNGHIVDQGFLPLYLELGGEKVVGRPLTELHYNLEMKRYEQYFANLGFFRLENDPPDKISLLAYGSWKCDHHCRYQSPMNATIRFPALSEGPGYEFFMKEYETLGVNFTGRPLVQPYLTEAGKWEQIFENVVMTADPDEPRKVHLRALTEDLGILPQAPVPVSQEAGMVFWSPEGSQEGYQVPQLFWDYLNEHGGIKTSGKPITSVFITNDAVARQCFTNLCLDYYLSPSTPASLRIRPANLGYAYMDLFYKASETMDFIYDRAQHALTLEVWERYPVISSRENQEIGAGVFEGITPLSKIEPILIVSYPDGTQQASIFPPTGRDGLTTTQLEPIEAANGSRVAYQVCISTLERELFCLRDSFVIWMNP